MKLHRLYYWIVCFFLCKEAHDTRDESSAIIKEKNSVANTDLNSLFASTDVRMPTFYF